MPRNERYPDGSVSGANIIAAGVVGLCMLLGVGLWAGGVVFFANSVSSASQQTDSAAPQQGAETTGAALPKR